MFEKEVINVFQWSAESAYCKMMRIEFRGEFFYPTDDWFESDLMDFVRCQVFVSR